MTYASATTTASPSRVSAVLLSSTPTGQPLLGVVGKRTYDVWRGALREAREQIPLVEQPQLSSDESILHHDTDLIMNRTGVDIVVQGHAYPHEGTNVFPVTVCAGAFQRSIVAFGDRQCEQQGGLLRFTPPESVTKIPLIWESAYGGVDYVARRDFGGPYESFLKDAGLDDDPRFGPFGYPRNPVGKGYLIEPTADAIARCRLPNLEDAGQPLVPRTLARGDFLRWPDGPPVASFGWLPYNYFPRSAHLGFPLALYDHTRLKPEVFVEVRENWICPEAVLERTTIPGRRDPRMCQSSAVGMRAESMQGAQKVELLNLHPKERLWGFALQAESPRFGIRLPGGKAQELKPQMRTLLIEPDRDRVTVVWVGEHPLDVPPPPEVLEEIRHVVVWTG